MKHYNYRPFVEALEEFVAGLNKPAASRALDKLKFIVLATAWCDYRIWAVAGEEEAAMSAAWEDMRVAFSGFGDSALTGAVIHLWTAIGSDHWIEGREAVNRGAVRAEDTTSLTVSRRYLHRYRNKTVRTPNMGFDLPAIVPTSGPRLREWAESNSLCPDSTEEKMALIEEYERLGLIDLEGGGYYVGHGGKELAASDDVEASLRDESGPRLTLVK
tara:strand:- start:88 stop:735 length:648 start_codon:yes stop_codon:yes gene_type:complete